MLISWLRGEALRPHYEEDTGQPAGDDPAVSPPTQAEQAPAPEPFDKDRAMATIAKLREFEKSAKAQLKELEALKADREKAKLAELSELEREKAEKAQLQTQLDAAASQLKRATLKEAIAEAAAKANLTFAQGALSDALTLGLFDGLEWDGEKPKGVGAAVKELSIARAYLFAPPAQAPDIGALERGKPKNGTDQTSLAQRWGIKVG